MLFKKAPLYKKAPPLLGTDLEQGGAFLSLIRAEGPRKIWMFCIENIDFQSKNYSESVQKAQNFRLRRALARRGSERGLIRYISSISRRRRENFGVPN